MDTIFVVVVILFVVAVLALAAYALFELTPFARHTDQFRNPRTGRRRFESPHL